MGKIWRNRRYELRWQRHEADWQGLQFCEIVRFVSPIVFASLRFLGVWDRWEQRIAVGIRWEYAFKLYLRSLDFKLELCDDFFAQVIFGF